MDARQRTLRAKKAAFARWAKEDPRIAMVKVRRGRTLKLQERVLQEAQRRGEVINEEEIARRAESQRRSDNAGWLLKANKARAA